MTNQHLRPIDQAAILRRFSTSGGLPLVLERTLQTDHLFLSVEKIDGGQHKLETVADLGIVTATGHVKDPKLINQQGLWRTDQLHTWVREAETALIELVAQTPDALTSSPDLAS